MADELEINDLKVLTKIIYDKALEITWEGDGLQWWRILKPHLYDTPIEGLEWRYHSVKLTNTCYAKFIGTNNVTDIMALPNTIPTHFLRQQVNIPVNSPLSLRKLCQLYWNFGMWHSYISENLECPDFNIYIQVQANVKEQIITNLKNMDYKEEISDIKNVMKEYQVCVLEEQQIHSNLCDKFIMICKNNMSFFFHIMILLLAWFMIMEYDYVNCITLA